MRARYLTADVFTDRRFGGNQLAVFPDAREIAPGLMPQIAREFNYSETTFVLPPTTRAIPPSAHLHTRRRVAVCWPSHSRDRARPREHWRRSSHRSRDSDRFRGGRGTGPGNDTMRRTADRRSLSCPWPRCPSSGRRHRPERRWPRCCRCRTMTCCDGDMRPKRSRAARRFSSFRCATVARWAARASSAICWRAALRGYVTDKVFLFAMDPELPGSHVRARMFAPGIGVPEDPATGSAASRSAAILRRGTPEATARCAGSSSRASRWAGRAFSRSRPTNRAARSPPHASAESRDGLRRTNGSWVTDRMRRPPPATRARRDFGQSCLSSRDSARSASKLPSVWQRAQ